MATEFSVFMQGIRIVYGVQDDSGSFIDSFFDETIIECEEKTKLFNIYSNQFRQYCNGSRNITKIVNILLSKTDFEQFDEMLLELDYGQVDLLIEYYKNYYSDMSVENFSDKIISLYKQILLNAHNPSSAIPLPRNIDYEIEHNSRIAKITNTFGPKLFTEAEGICPWCCDPLITESYETSAFSYKVFEIEQHNNPNFKSLVALCHKCFKKFYLGESASNLLELSNIKKDMSNRYDNRVTLNNEKVEKDIRNLLEAIVNVDYDSLVDLRMNPITVKKKLKDNYSLYMKVREYAADYYGFISDTLKDLHSEGVINSELFQHKVRGCFLRLKDSNSKPEIFNLLVKWLQDQTRKEKYVCEILISYYVQHCEVYDEIPE